MRLTRLALTCFAILAFVQLFAVRAVAQCDLYTIWVDPANGIDDGDAKEAKQLNDPRHPCRTMQFAIDRLYLNLCDLYRSDPVLNASWQGIVYCLPGVYGPQATHGSLSSGDALPINMRDRVHVQGLNARACVIRGTLLADGSNQGYYLAFWPTKNPFPQYLMKHSEVLVAFRESSQYSQYPNLGPADVPDFSKLPPWVATGETAERFDGFTLQGGDIQVLFATHSPINNPLHGIVRRAHPLAGRVSNCVFDMRNGWYANSQDPTAPTGVRTQYVGGPTFGIMSSPGYNDYPPEGYFAHDVMIANNTFIMAEYGGGWINDCKAEAVAITDVTDPRLYTVAMVTGTPDPFYVPGAPSQNFAALLRGLGNPCVINNLIRTRPDDGAQISQIRGTATLGIDMTDCRVWNALANSFQDTNAFAVPKARAFNQNFMSNPVKPVLVSPLGLVAFAPNYFFYEPVYNCQGQLPPQTPTPCTSATLPSPAVPLWNGNANPSSPEYDPMFVGEHLRASPGSGVASDYTDWRILPISPLVNAGYYREPLLVENGNSVPFQYDSTCRELRTFDYDGEGYGNLRKVDAPDIGFDEFQVLIVAGSYANDSICHNDNSLPSAVLSPISMSSGTGLRHLITSNVYAPGTSMIVHGTMTSAVGTDPGWVQPPGTLPTATTDIAAPVGYRLRYIPYTADPVPPPLTNPTMPWSFLLGANGFWANPMNLPPSGINQNTFCDFAHTDSECGGAPSCANEYFCMQAFIDGYPSAGRHHNSNLQFDYR